MEFVEYKDDIGSLPIRVTNNSYSFCFSIDGKRNNVIVCEECMLFPSKDVRTWDNFKPKNPKFDPKTLISFDRVLARIDGGDAYCWFADFVSTPVIEKYDILPCIMSNKVTKMIIPYNDETKHLVGTANDCPEYYKWWEA